MSADACVHFPPEEATAQAESTANLAIPESTASDRSTGEVPADVYHKHRRLANQLTQRWRKTVRAATTAFAVNDHSGTPSPRRLTASELVAWGSGS